MSGEAHHRPGVAVVTGAARGIGAAVAQRLARDGFGVAALDLTEEACRGTVDAVLAGGGVAVAAAADVSDETAIAAAIDRVAAALGPPTVVVNNAGIARAAGVGVMSTADWDDVIGTDLSGAFFATRAVVPYMVDAGWGRLVNVSSVSAFGDPGRVGYASAKAGLIGMTRTLAVELGQHGITSNAVAPGFIVSEMTAASARRLGRDVEEHQRLAAASIPAGRVGLPEDVAHAVSFLSSREAGFVSGQVICVAGGPV
jgi:NAD(P)-dependent dehydrogenase (short-subunit alcohol dehydrogenase family)